MGDYESLTGLENVAVQIVCLLDVVHGHAAGHCDHGQRRAFLHHVDVVGWIQDGRPVRLPERALAENEPAFRIKPGVDHIDGVVHGQRDMAYVGGPGRVLADERVVARHADSLP